MANDFFQFKHFLIKQGLCGMKVCTDSCIFGAYVEVTQSKRILDIGTGTGLLALMLAQRSSAMIDAVEIDDSAFAQAQENIISSSWKTRIQIFHQSIQNFCSNDSDKKYDTIISNPPFFENHLKSSHPQKNIALHNDFLSIDDLLQAVQSLLAVNGSFWVLLPPFEANKFFESAKKRELYLQKSLFIHNRPKQPIFRVIHQFAFQEKPPEPISEFLYIKDDSHQYTTAFVQLLKDYYMIF